MKKTHYSRSEATDIILREFLNYSAQTFIYVQQKYEIKFVWAGTQELISTAELNRYVQALKDTPVKEVNGFFLVDL